MYYTLPSTEQITSIIATIAQEDTKLKKFDLDGNDLSHVEPEVLARAAVKLEELGLKDTKLRTEQISSILATIAQEDTKLKKLNLEGNDLSHVEPEVLARAAVKLEELDLSYTELRPEQITSIFTTIPQEDTKLKKLNLEGNDLSHVEPEVLATGAVKLEQLGLQDTKLRPDQITSIIITIAQEDIKLKKLNLCGNDLSHVEPEVLSRAAVTLEEWDVSWAELRTEQITSILTQEVETVE